MGLRRWLSRRLVGDVSSRVDLVEPGEVLIAPPARAGLPPRGIPAPWSVSRLQALFQAMEHQPSVENYRAARLARYQLSQFWLAVPVDQLQTLFGSSIGDLQRVLLEGPLVKQELARDEQKWRDQLANKLFSSNNAIQRINFLLALMPYSPPGTLKLADPAGMVPDWLMGSYSTYCDPESIYVAPVGLLEPAEEAKFFPLTQRRGEDAMTWFRDDVAIQRMKELISAYVHDSSDKETCLELSGLRRVLAQLWIDIIPTQLQQLEKTPVGTITNELIRSGFGRELPSELDEQARKRLCDQATDFSQPEAAGILLAALMFVPLERVKIESIEALPDWCVAFLKDLS